jgi:hypothetical protein
MDAQRVAYKQSHATRMESSVCLVEAFRILGLPRTMADIGCGAGHLVAMAQGMGVRSYGVDMFYPEQPFEGFIHADLAQPMSWRPPFHADLTLCLEVAEHLPQSAAETLCDTLRSVTGSSLLFSAAVPGQGGSGHLNEQPHSYWTEKLEQRGFVQERAATQELRRCWLRSAPSAWWYGRNVIALRRFPC